MRIRVKRWIGLASMAGVILAALGCKSDRRYTAEMTAGGRTVKVTSDRIASITFDNHNFVISLSAKKCIVERERLLYDGKEQAKIPGEATSVVIEFIGGNLLVVADGQTVRAASPPL
jgi:hypothetical protein